MNWSCLWTVVPYGKNSVLLEVTCRNRNVYWNKGGREGIWAIDVNIMLYQVVTICISHECVSYAIVVWRPPSKDLTATDFLFLLLLLFLLISILFWLFCRILRLYWGIINFLLGFLLRLRRRFYLNFDIFWVTLNTFRIALEILSLVWVSFNIFGITLWILSLVWVTFDIFRIATLILGLVWVTFDIFRIVLSILSLFCGFFNLRYNLAAGLLNRNLNLVCSLFVFFIVRLWSFHVKFPIRVSLLRVVLFLLDFCWSIFLLFWPSHHNIILEPWDRKVQDLMNHVVISFRDYKWDFPNIRV